jgi:hypothetical protein
MDDMKNLIEKYKQELMEYSKSSAPREIPKKLEFPEMLDSSDEADNANEAAEAAEEREEALEPDIYEEREEQPVEEKPAPRKPEIIGYVADDGVLSNYNDIFAGMLSNVNNAAQSDNDNEDNTEEETEPAEPQYPEPDKLPSQRELAEDNTKNSRPEDTPEFSGELSGVTDNSPTEPLPSFIQPQRVSPEQAERLTQEPISAGSPSARLTGRSFESNTPAVNSPKDIAPLVTQPRNNSSVYSDAAEKPEYAVPISDNRADGAVNLQFRVYTAYEALPIAGAVCKIKKNIDGAETILYTLTTDISGQTKAVHLSAPSPSLSQTPDSAEQPYALYDAAVSADGYTPVLITDIPIFSGILSVQSVAMVPAAGLNNTERIDESEPQTNGGV